MRGEAHPVREIDGTDYDGWLGRLIAMLNEPVALVVITKGSPRRSAKYKWHIGQLHCASSTEIVLYQYDIFGRPMPHPTVTVEAATIADPQYVVLFRRVFVPSR